MQDKKKYYSAEKQAILDKYIGKKRYGELNPLIHEIFQRRQYEFDIPIDEFEKEVKNFRRNVKAIVFPPKDLSEEILDKFLGVYLKDLPIIAFNRAKLAELHQDILNGTKSESDFEKFYELLTHEVYHAISHKGKNLGIAEKRFMEPTVEGVGLNEITNEMAASRASLPITQEEIRNGRQNTYCYTDFTPLGSFLKLATGMSEKEFLKSGIKNRQEFRDAIYSKFPKASKEDVDKYLDIYQTDLDIYYNSSVIECEGEKRLSQFTLSGIIDTGYMIAMEQIKSDNRELTPEYISEINYRYNKMEEFSKLYGEILNTNENLKLENSSVKQQFKRIVADLNKAFLIKDMVQYSGTRELLIEAAKIGTFMDEAKFVLKHQNIDIESFDFSNIEKDGKFPVSEKYEEQRKSEEFDDGKVYDNTFVIEQSRKILEEKTKDVTLESVLSNVKERISNFFNRFRNQKKLPPGNENMEVEHTEAENPWKVSEEELRPLEEVKAEKASKAVNKELNGQSSEGHSYPDEQ